MTALVETERAVVRIGTRGSPLALAQAYQTRDRLQVCAFAKATSLQNPRLNLRVCVDGKCFSLSQPLRAALQVANKVKRHTLCPLPPVLTFCCLPGGLYSRKQHLP